MISRIENNSEYLAAYSKYVELKKRISLQFRSSDTLTDEKMIYLNELDAQSSIEQEKAALSLLKNVKSKSELGIYYLEAFMKAFREDDIYKISILFELKRRGNINDTILAEVYNAFVAYFANKYNDDTFYTRRYNIIAPERALVWLIEEKAAKNPCQLVKSIIEMNLRPGTTDASEEEFVRKSLLLLYQCENKSEAIAIARQATQHTSDIVYEDAELILKQLEKENNQ